MRRLKVNKIKCNKCGDVIESTHRHDMKWCSCNSCAVDGGHDYARRCYSEKGCYTELSEWEKEDDDVEL